MIVLVSKRVLPSPIGKFTEAREDAVTSIVVRSALTRGPT